MKGLISRVYRISYLWTTANSGIHPFRLPSDAHRTCMLDISPSSWRRTDDLVRLHGYRLPQSIRGRGWGMQHNVVPFRTSCIPSSWEGFRRLGCCLTGSRPKFRSLGVTAGIPIAMPAGEKGSPPFLTQNYGRGKQPPYQYRQATPWNSLSWLWIQVSWNECWGADTERMFRLSGKLSDFALVLFFSKKISLKSSK